jgi:hypothetical protein
MGVYTNPKKLLLNVSQKGTQGVKLKLERARLGSKSTYETYGTYDISGWSG